MTTIKSNDAQAIATAFARPTLTLGVTDSGLGGLSIAAHLAERFRHAGEADRVRILYFNCRPSATLGFNGMDRPRQCRVFGRVLDCLAKRFNVDATIVACNTLSVLLSNVRCARVPVLGVVDAGIDAIASFLAKQPDAQIVILGTATTIRSGAHRRGLRARGLAHADIIEQDCPGLEAAIETRHDHVDTIAMIDHYVDAAAARIKADRPVGVALCCTHYPLAMARWRERFALRGLDVTLIDPSARLVSSALQAAPTRSTPADVAIEVVSQTPLANQTRQSIARLIDPISPATAAALLRDTVEPELFAVS